ncbi:efflux RND transporter periplasmic adaptor subunit [Frigidibacter sp. MR17.14]|uniref:efflux RND transporter periplasmic adaptor subunit n=1 Tax=Frigidibacter sp. MR17.14 TaxID=3126509 RepID=UPI003012B9E7
MARLHSLCLAVFAGLCSPAFAADAPAQLRTVAPRAAMVPGYLETTGTVAASRQVDLVARVPGVLIEAPVRDGAPVRAGDRLFRIEPDPYEADVAAAQAAVAGAEAQLRRSEADYLRQQELAERQVTPMSQLDAAEAARDGARADLDAARAQRRTADITLGYTQITAPFDGILSARTADPGAYVGASGAEVLASLYATDPLHVEFSVSEADLSAVLDTIRASGPAGAEIELGQTGTDFYPLRARLDYIAPTLATDLGTLALRATLPNAGVMITPGVTLRLRLALGAPQRRLMLPPAAIGTDLEGRHVLTIEEGHLRRRPVQVAGGMIDGLLPVTGDLRSDAVVVANVAAAPPVGSAATAKP